MVSLPSQLFVTAIGTDSGKTLVSAILTQALKADYWKPIQAGLPRDTETVKSLVSNPTSMFYTERHLLLHPISPHAAAEKENIRIHLHDFELPTTSRPLVVEGAGGILVPINEEHFIIDLAEYLALPIILVANLYLGSINHTLLSIQELNRRKLNCVGIIFNGHANESSQDIIQKHSPFPVLFHVPFLPTVHASTIAQLAAKFGTTLKMNDDFR